MTDLANLPTLEFVTSSHGQTRHIKGGKRAVLCNQFDADVELIDATADEDGRYALKLICSGCLKQLPNGRYGTA